MIASCVLSACLINEYTAIQYQRRAVDGESYTEALERGTSSESSAEVRISRPSAQGQGQGHRSQKAVPIDLQTLLPPVNVA